MKTIRHFMVLFLGLLLGATACNNDYDLPPLEIPTATLTPNTSILELKTIFQGNVDTIGKNAEGEDYIISGVVVGNDVSGNIYKSLMIQDETAAITISVNGTGLYTTYRLGQKVVLNCTGLYIGKYAKLQQLGYPATGKDEMTFMPLAAFQQNVELSGLPDAQFDTLVVTISELGTTTNDLLYYQSRLVELKDVFFQQGGKATFANTSSAASRYIQDASGKTLVVRNSNYSDFATDTLPSGTGNVVGILSYFNNAYQLLLRERSDVYDFTGN